MKEENRSINWLLLLLLSAACIITILMLLEFSNRIMNNAVTTLESSMEDVAEGYSQIIYGELQMTAKAGTTLAQMINMSEEGNVNNDEMTGSFLKILVEQTALYAAEYYEIDGDAINQDGQIVDLSQKEYLSLINESTDTHYLYLASDDEVNQDTILIIAPSKDKSYTLLMYYPIEYFNNLFDAGREFDKETFSAVIDLNGKLLLTGGHESCFTSGEGLLDNLDEENSNKVSTMRIRILSDDSGCIKLKSGGESRTLVYSPIGMNDWAFVLGVNQNYVDVRERQLWNDEFKMLYQLLVVIALCIIMLLIVNILGKKQNSEKSKILQEKLDTDLLTGLNNKLAVERKIKEYLKDNTDARAMLFVIDIDNFKKINDTMGHAFGDETLRTLGRHIGSNFRVTDIIGRTGGDEFMVFLKNLKDDDSVQREAKKMVFFFNSFQVGEYVKYVPTASVGVAVFPTDGDNFEALYKSADSALYRAKKRGKNQLVFYDDRTYME